MSIALLMLGMALMRLSTVSRMSFDLTRRRGLKARKTFSTLTVFWAILKALLLPYISSMIIMIFCAIIVVTSMKSKQLNGSLKYEFSPITKPNAIIRIIVSTKKKYDTK